MERTGHSSSRAALIYLHSTSDVSAPWPTLLPTALAQNLTRLRVARVWHDRLDAVWLCKLAERGMLRPSFVSPPWQRELRDL
jgi:hypothetical protein